MRFFPIFIITFLAMLISDQAESYTPSPIYSTVNVITGEYSEANCDLSLEGPFRLQLHRIFSNTTLPHWQFNHPNIFQNSPAVSDGVLQPTSLALYDYDSHRRLAAIRQTSLNGLLEFHKISFEYNQSPAAPKCIINTGSDSSITYYYKSASRLRNAPPYIIDKIVDADQFTTEYLYENDATGQRKIVVGKNEPNGRYLKSAYDAKGRVICQWAPLGTDQTPVVKYRFTYLEGSTIVEDAHQQRVIYRHNGKELTSIEYYDCHQLIQTELFFWKSINDVNRLVSKAIKEKSGAILSVKSFKYDNQGHVIEEKIYGNLTGLNNAKIDLNEEGEVANNGVESYATYFEYASQFPYNLLSKREDNGHKTVYHYLEGTQLVTAKYVISEGIIRMRHFYTYDQNQLVNKTILDDGSSFDPETMEGVTTRQITYSTYQFNPVTYEYQELLEEKGLNLKTGQEEPIRQTLNIYSGQGKLIEQKTYDAAGQLYLSLSYTYDRCGKKTSSRDLDNTYTEYLYDQNRNLQQTITTDAQGTCESLIHLYDFSNRIIRTERRTSKGPTEISLYKYNYLSQLIQETDACGNETNYEYDAMGHRVKTVYPEILDANGVPYRPCVIKEYNALGQIVSSIDANGQKTTISHNARGNPTRVEFPDHSIEIFEYTLDGSLVKHLKKDGVTSLYEYDYLSRVTKITEIDREGIPYSTICNRYNGFHLIAKQERGIITEYTYDARGNLTQTLETKGESWKKKESTYGAQGELLSESEIYQEGPQLNLHKSFVRDEKGKVRETLWKDSAGNTLKTEQRQEKASEKEDHTHYNYRYYNPQGQTVLQTTRVNDQGFTILTTLDTLRRVDTIEKRDPFGRTISKQQMRYDGNGNKIEELHHAFENGKFCKSFKIVWEYDENNRLVTIINAAGSCHQTITRYSYHSNGKISTILQPNGTELFYHYDAKNRLQSFSGSDHQFDYHYQYDEDNRLLSVEDRVTGTITQRSYNDAGQLKYEKLGNNLELTYERDTLQRPTKVSLPDGSQVIYEYGPINLEAIKRLSKEGELLYTYRPSLYTHAGKVAEIDMIANLGKIDLSYDEKQRLNGQKSPYFSQGIKYDEKESVIEVMTKDSLGEITYLCNYDEREQLLNDGYCEYRYDSFFNRTSYNGKQLLINEANQLIESDEILYEYDSNERLCKKRWKESGKEIHYRYDALNRLIEVQGDHFNVHYQYDAFGRCLSKTKRSGDNVAKIHYLYDGQKEIGAATEANELFELRILNPLFPSEQNATVAIEIEGKSYAPLHDLQGSITVLVDTATKEVVENYRYTAFGEVMEQAQERKISPWLFSGKRFDADTGLIAFGQRHYDPQMGRWITPDPLKHIDGMNHYAYLINNPLSSYDMWGHFWLSSLWDNFLYDVENVVKTVLSFRHLSLLGALSQDMNLVLEPIFGKMFLLMHGFYAENEMAGFYGKGEIHDKIRITCLNGLLNVSESCQETAAKISSTHGNTNVHYIYDPTRGWTGDAVKGFLAKCGYRSPATKLLAQKWKSLIEEMGGVNGGGMILHYAHSMGGTNTALARDLLTPEEQKMIKVITIASATVVPNKGFASVVNYISGCDFVGLLDPIPYFSSFFNESNIVHIESDLGIPLIDHLISAGTYSKLLEILGQEFLETHQLDKIP